MTILVPVKWTTEQLTTDAASSKAIFRTERLEEEPGNYRNYYDRFEPIVRAIVVSLRAIAQGTADICPYLEHKDQWAALRYVTAPPISNDDLATLANVRFDRAFLTRPTDIASTTRILLELADPFRFPWLSEGRDPIGDEVEFATSATSMMLASQTVETYRRTTAKEEQEAGVKQALVNAGMQVGLTLARTTFATAPQPGYFCNETKFGGTKADIVARLSDHRVMLIECKSSNSEVNSYKRINHEAAGKARTWLNRIGSENVVPCATISGVFRPANLASAQDDGLNIFWQFRLSDLTDYVLAIRDA